MLNATNPKQENFEEVIIHELLHLKLYPLDQLTEGLIEGHYQPDTPEYDTIYRQFMTMLEQTVEEKKQIAVYNEGGALLITLEADSVEVYTSTLDGRYVAELLVKSGESTALYLAVAED